ncbi:MAG: hypothetical protein KDE54_32120 [Caldilineaceae bacterium]|nr:hypothetical protein [Caldilineaceae bacterium]
MNQMLDTILNQETPSLAMLLEQFDGVIQTLADVEKLNAFILNLAVRGLLVSQDISDEPASMLMEWIVVENEELIEGGILKKPKPLPSIDAEEIKFPLPSSWQWERLGMLGITQTGSTPSKKRPDFFGSDIPFLKPADIQPEGIDYENEGLSYDGLERGRLIRADSALMVCIG